jgi:hypothetical protein
MAPNAVNATRQIEEYHFWLSRKDSWYCTTPGYKMSQLWSVLTDATVNLKDAMKISGQLD